MSASVGVGVSPESWLRPSADLRVRRSSTRDDVDRFFSTLGSLYGDGDFTTLGIGGRLVFDRLPDDGRAGLAYGIRNHPRTALTTVRGAMEEREVLRSYQRDFCASAPDEAEEYGAAGWVFGNRLFLNALFFGDHVEAP